MLLIRIPILQPIELKMPSRCSFSIYIECDARTLDRNDRICLCLRVYYECNRRLLVDLPLKYLLHGIGACRIHYYMAHIFWLCCLCFCSVLILNFNVYSMVKYKCQNQAKISIDWLDSIHPEISFPRKSGKMSTQKMHENFSSYAHTFYTHMYL